MKFLAYIGAAFLLMGAYRLWRYLQQFARYKKVCDDLWLTPAQNKFLAEMAMEMSRQLPGRPTHQQWLLFGLAIGNLGATIAETYVRGSITRAEALEMFCHAMEEVKRDHDKSYREKAESAKGSGMARAARTDDATLPEPKSGGTVGR